MNRVISVVPSLTELLFYLDLNEAIPAVTKYCVHPSSMVSPKIKVGGTKKLELHTIKMLNPQLVIANKEENSREQIEELERSVPVWVSDIANLDQATNAILQIGKMVQRSGKAQELTHQILSEFKALVTVKDLKPALYMIWRKPYMVAGNDTFISNMLPYAGFTNIINAPRYPQLSADQISALNPPTILLSSEPFPFQDRHRRELKSICPQARILLVDGQMFSWYGSRLLLAPGYFKHLRDEEKE